jgi:hypothetical protein
VSRGPFNGCPPPVFCCVHLGLTKPFFEAWPAFYLDVKEFKNVIRDCTIFIFRYLSIGEQESKELEKVFSDLAINIRRREITKASQVRERLLKLDLSDKLLESLLEAKDIKLNKVATYILTKIEQKLDPGQKKFSSKITLEHILPKAPDEEWNKYSPAPIRDVKKMVYASNKPRGHFGHPPCKYRRPYLPSPRVYFQFGIF